MNITLIYPGFKEDASGLSEPLGILYIASVLRNKNHKISFIDMTFNKDKNILEKVAKNSDLIGMSCTSLLFERASKLAKEIKRTNPQVPIFLGGSHGTINPKSTLNAGFDYIIIGEGETTIKKLADAIERLSFHQPMAGGRTNLEKMRGGVSEHFDKKSKVDSIDGLAFKKNNKININPKKSFIKNLDEIPLPARDLWNYKQYFKTGTTEIGIIATRGCPYNCLYCKPMVDKLFGNKARKRSPKNVIKEIEQIANSYKHLFRGKIKLFFKDDTLTLCGIDWFEKFKKELEKRKLKIDWGCHTRVDNVNYELLKVMKESGLNHISFGVESGSQKILNYYRKGTTVEQTIKAFKMCKKLRIETFAYFMIGAPIETKEDLEMTYRLIKKIKPDGLEVYTTMPYPGNDLYNLVKQNKLLKTGGKIDYYAKHSLMKLQYLTDIDLNECRRKIYKLNNKQLMVKYFTSFTKFKKLIKYIINRPGFVINYLKRSL